MDLKEEEEKEIEEIKDDVCLSNPAVTNIPIPTSIPATSHHVSNGVPLLPHTQPSMSVLTPTQSYVVEQKKKENTSTINLAEFESYSTNPFEEMELKTLNDKEELAMLLQPPAPQQPDYGFQFQNFNVTWPETVPQMYQPMPQQYVPAATNWIQNGNHDPFLHHQMLQQKMEQITFGNGSVPTGGNTTVFASQGSLRQAKSVPDLSADAGITDVASWMDPVSTVFPSPDKRLSSRTPPPRFTSDDAPSARPVPKPILQSQWERNLNAAEKRLVQQLSDMGFQRDRCARAITRLGPNHKDVVDQLLLIQKLEDSSYSLVSIESALELLKPGEDFSRRVEQHAQLFDQLSALGFDQSKIGAALVAAGHDRDKALDFLLMM